MTTSSNSPSQAAPGLVVGARYKLESVLGEGGMAVVWRAKHTETDREVALKLVRRDLVLDAGVREMFVREARITARIGPNAHIVDVLDAGVDAALEVPFIAMELLAGEGLDARIKAQGPVEAAMACDILEQVADALDQAHQAGVVHRDLKPQNLFLARDKKQRLTTKVLDFGIAKLAESAQQSSTQVGTPAYAAPEQLGASWRTISAQRGKPIAESVSPATDVWALGLVVYEMLIGSASGTLWGATTLAELPVKMVLEPTPVATVRAGAKRGLLPNGFDAWLARCLDLDSTRRFPSAGEAAAALSPALRALASRSSSPAFPAQNAGNFPSQPPPQMPTSQPLPHPPGGAHGSQPFLSQPLPSQPLPSQPLPSQPIPSQPLPLQPISSQQLPSQSHPNQGLPAQGVQSQPNLGWGVPAQTNWAAPTQFASGVQAPAPPVAQFGNIDPRLASWLTMRRAQIVPQPDSRVYLAWNPFHFIPPIMQVVREIRLPMREATVALVDVLVSDTVRNMTGDDRLLLAFVTSPRILYPAGIRSRQSSGFAEGVSRVFDLFSTPNQKIGDPRFEGQFEVGCANPAMGNAAIPYALRELLLNGAFRGKLELRQGGFALEVAQATRFDPTEFEAVVEIASKIYFTLAP